MKKAVILGLSLLFVVLVPFSTVVKAVETETGYISVSERITKEILPTQATITVGIETYGDSAQKASDENKKIAQNVHSALKKLLSDKDSIKTGEYSLSPQYIYTKDNKKVLDKYMVKNSVVVTVFNLKLVSKLIDTAISNGATKIDDLNFSATDFDNSCSAALGELAKKAQSKANFIAKSLNLQVFGVKSLSTSCNPEYNSQRVFYSLAKGVADATAPQTPIESGKIKIDASVDALFYVK